MQGKTNKSRGILSVLMEQTLVNLHPDWLAVTLPKDTLKKLTDFFNGFTMVVKTPRFGYTVAIGIEGTGLTIMMEGHVESMGIHLQITGKGLDFLRRNGVDMDAFYLFIKGLGGKLTRLDIAWDCHGYGRNAEYYKKAHDEGHLVTRLRKTSWTVSKKDGVESGTFYLGSRVGKIFCRIYDKGAMIGEKDLTRIELELKGSRADHAFECLINKDIAQLNGLLRGVFDLRTIRTGKNLTRWTADPIWVQMMGYTRIAFPIIYRVSDFKHTIEWLSRSVGTSLVMLEKVGINVEDFMHSIIRESRSRLKTRHHQMIREFLYEEKKVVIADHQLLLC